MSKILLRRPRYHEDRGSVVKLELDPPWVFRTEKRVSGTGYQDTLKNQGANNIVDRIPWAWASCFVVGLDIL